jgi:dehydrodolichyl diphosphate syntase complex subunit NUS1
VHQPQIFLASNDHIAHVQLTAQQSFLAFFLSFFCHVSNHLKLYYQHSAAPAMASTGVTPKEEAAFLRDTLDGKKLTPQQREALMKPRLPPAPISAPPPSARASSTRTKPRASRVNKLKTGPIRNVLHFIIHQTIAFLFSIFFRFRRSWRLFWYKVRGVMGHHHRSPEWIVNDVRNTEQLPQHLSVVLDYSEDDDDQGTAGLEGLLNDVCEIAAWSASAGIPLVSIYERTGWAPQPSVLLTCANYTQVP